jgi:hypothetical protein
LGCELVDQGTGTVGDQETQGQQRHLALPVPSELARGGFDLEEVYLLVAEGHSPSQPVELRPQYGE